MRKDEEDLPARLETLEQGLAALQADHDRLRAMADATGEALFIKDLAGHYVALNVAAAAALGGSVEEILGRTDRELLALDVARELEEADRLVARLAEPITLHEVVTRGESRRDFESTKSPYRDGHGAVVGVLGVARDVTRRKAAEDALTGLAAEKARASAHLAAVLETVDVGLLVEEDDVVTVANRAFCEIFELTGRQACRGIPADELARVVAARFRDPEGFLRERQAVVREGRPTRGEELALRDGRVLERSLFVLEGGGIDRGLMWRYRDATESRRAAQLKQRFVESLTEALDQERRRVARALHDETGQALTRLIAGLEGLEDAADVEAARAQAADLRRLVSATVDEVGRLARGLHPSVLDDLGLRPAIERLAAEFSRASGVSVTHALGGLDDSADLPLGLATTLYRVVQEAMTNVAKHARATELSVVVTRDHGSLRVVVEDNGVGFDPDLVARANPGLGLTGMRERMALHGGTAKFESRPGRGTIVAVAVPLAR